MLARSLQKKVAASRFHIFRQSQDSVLLSFDFYQPVAGIFYGKPRLLNSEGKIFGIFQETKHSHLPYIKGIEISNKLVFLDDQSVSISEKNLTILKEVLYLSTPVYVTILNIRRLNLTPIADFPPYCGTSEFA